MPDIRPEWKTLAIGTIGFILMAVALFSVFCWGERDRIAFESTPATICNGMALPGYPLFGFLAAILPGAVVGCLAVLANPAVRHTTEDTTHAGLQYFAITAILIVVFMPLFTFLGSTVMSGTPTLSSGRIWEYLWEITVLQTSIGFLTLPGFFSAAVSGAITLRLFYR